MYNEIYFSAWGVRIGTAKKVIREYDREDTVYDDDLNPVMVKHLIEEERHKWEKEQEKAAKNNKPE